MATCNAAGASKWRPEWAHYFDGKVVTVYYYNDGVHTERFIAATTWDPGSP